MDAVLGRYRKATSRIFVFFRFMFELEKSRVKFSDMVYATLKYPRMVHSAVWALGLSCQRLQLNILRRAIMSGLVEGLVQVFRLSFSKG
jgi:hypothetical protein